ncbi:MAG: 3-ketoacyl-ACP reductase [Anaerolineae bacterium]|nr:3-ketoacyl-ACP reductase [Anaerolineae bacterium]
MSDPGALRRVAIVTGGSRGIGRAIALALGGRGWAVAVNYHSRAAAAAEVVQEIEAAGGQAIALQADIADIAGHAAFGGAVLERFGRIDLLVNNAGMAPRRRLDILQMSAASYDEVMGVNLKGPFFFTQWAANLMIELVEAGAVEAPKIVNIGSISAYTSSLNRGEYCISKAGMGMMTALFADRLAEYGINVYEIRPGIVETDMTGAVKDKYDKLIAEGLTPLKRWGRPEDIARAVLAIAEGYLPFSTGEVINVDGGFHLRRL